LAQRFRCVHTPHSPRPTRRMFIHHALRVPHATTNFEITARNATTRMYVSLTLEYTHQFRRTCCSFNHHKGARILWTCSSCTHALSPFVHTSTFLRLHCTYVRPPVPLTRFFSFSTVVSGRGARVKQKRQSISPRVAHRSRTSSWSIGQSPAQPQAAHRRQGRWQGSGEIARTHAHSFFVRALGVSWCC
jgi:hypothetical protein